jgi:hypothetical protein
LVDALGSDLLHDKAAVWLVPNAVDGVLGEPRAITAQGLRLSRSGGLRKKEEDGRTEEPS